MIPPRTRDTAVPASPPESRSKDAAVKINVACVHVAVAPFGSTVNQWGAPGTPTLVLGKAYTAIAASKKRGEVICIKSESELPSLVTELRG